MDCSLRYYFQLILLWRILLCFLLAYGPFLNMVVLINVVQHFIVKGENCWNGKDFLSFMY